MLCTSVQALTVLTLRAPYETCNWVRALFIVEEAEAQQGQGLASSEWQDLDMLQLPECSVPGQDECQAEVGDGTT